MTHDHDHLHDCDGDGNMAFTRRAFLQRNFALAALAPTVPWFVQQGAMASAAPLGLSSIPGVAEERALVVVQLGGGNDGLNTVIPYFAPQYYDRRPTLAYRAPGSNPNATGWNADALPLDDKLGLGLHPALAPLKELHDDGEVATIPGCGYPNPNRSHFASMDIWHTADRNPSGSDGWLGRYFDTHPITEGSNEAAIAIGNNAPRALTGSSVPPIAFQSAQQFRWTGADIHESLGKTYQAMSGEAASTLSQAATANPQLDFLVRTNMDAQIAADRIRGAVRASNGVSYPGGSLANQLKLIAKMIRGGLRTRVFYASMGGFDTHSGQRGRHAQLMGQFANAINAFQKDLRESGDDERVMTMVFSEFGRRVGENASNGTDHGTAGPMFVIGKHVKGGVHGRHPNFTKLDSGDLRYTMDFRRVYAGVLSGWMQADPSKVVGAQHQPLAVV